LGVSESKNRNNGRREGVLGVYIGKGVGPLKADEQVGTPNYTAIFPIEAHAMGNYGKKGKPETVNRVTNNEADKRERGKTARG